MFFTDRADKFDDSTIVVEEGVGFNGIVLGDPSCDQEFIKEKLGKPNHETKQVLDYNRKYGFDFWMQTRKSPVSQICLNKRFKGKLSSGITIHSSMADVLKAYGEPITEQIVNDLRPCFENKVLYRREREESVFDGSKIFYNENGLLFWFRYEKINQIVVFKKKLGASPEKSKDIVVEEGVGFDGILIGDSKSTMESIKSKLGTPDEEKEQWLSYLGQYGFSFVAQDSTSPIRYIELVQGFGGRLSSGISMDSNMEEVFKTYGEPIATEDVEVFDQNYRDRVLYRKGEVERISYSEKGLKFRFVGSRITEISVFQKVGDRHYYSSAPANRRESTRQLETAMQRLLPRWLSPVRIARILNRVKRLHVGRYFVIIYFIILCLILKKPIMRLYWRWRPMPEGKLVVIQDPSGRQMESIALGQAARVLKKRRLVIGSGAQADIRLQHKSVEYSHAAVSARKAERVIITYIEQVGDGLLSVNGARGGVMILGRNADVQIGEFQFRYEKPADHPQTPERQIDGKPDAKPASATWKKVAIGCFFVFAALVMIIAVVGYLAFRHFRKTMTHRMEIPSGLTNPSIVKGSDFLSKSIFFEDPRLGDITDIKFGELDPSPGEEIGIAGSKGAAFLDENAGAKSAIMYSGIADGVDMIDTNGDGVCEFLNRGSWGRDASLIDHKGNTLWTYGGMPGVNDMDAGDMDGEGVMEFVGGFNGGGGVHLVDINGKKKWSQPDGNVWHVELVDTNADGLLEIVHSNAAGQMTVRDQNGNVIRRTKPGPYFSYFSLCKWPTKNDREYALLADNGTIWLFDFDGKSAAQFPAPDCGMLGHAQGTPVKLMADQPEYFATLVGFRHWNRAILYVHDSHGALVYQEILPETCASIAALPLDNSGTDTLLVGGGGKVLQYKLSNTKRQ